MARWLALLGPARAALPEAARLNFVARTWTFNSSWSAPHGVETWLAWSADFSPQQQRDLICQAPNCYHAFPDVHDPIWLLALEYGDARKRRACLSLLEAWAEVNPTPLLELLDTLLNWLTPARAAAIVDAVLPRVAVERLDAHRFAALLGRTAGRTINYRLQQRLLRFLWPRLDWRVKGRIRNLLPDEAHAPGMRWIHEQIRAVEAETGQQEMSG
jgi:hypothetical protein